MVDLQIGAKRYDGGSGPAVFTGVIPLKPGQLFESDLGTVKLLDGVTEVGVTPSALWPQHPDGSMKVVQIAATLDLAAGVQKDLTLRLGQARTVSGPAQPVVNDIWMKNPRLIGSIDAAHLCSSRVAPLPLVPIPNANLPAQWNKFLTEEWDDPATTYPSWGRFKAKVMADDHSQNLGGTASYNFVSAMYCKYLTSGELDRLNEAHHAAQFGSAERLYNGGLPISIFGACYGSNFNPPGSTNNGQLNGVVFNGDGTPFNANPDGWADRDPGSGPVTNSEWHNLDMDLFLGYQLSGWGQALGTFLCRALELFGRRGFPDNPGRIPAENGLGSNLDTSIIADNIFKGNYGGRAQWRHWHSADILYYLLSPPRAMYHHRASWKASTIPSPRTSDPADWKLWFKREHLDFFEKYSDRYVDGHWLKGSWWNTPGWWPANPDANIPQGLPFFQLKLLMFDVMLYAQNIDMDARIEPFIIGTADRLRRCVYGPVPTVKTPGTGYKLDYSIANSYTNNPTDGPQQAGPGGAFWPVTMNLLMFTAAYRITGDTFYRDLADMHASNTRMALSDGSRAGFSSPKEAGETYLDAFYAAAYRAGVPLGAWEIDGEIPPPPPPPPPPEATFRLEATTQFENQVHAIAYTGMRVRFQRSTDGGVTWVDVQSNVRPLGTTADVCDRPAGEGGQYRAGAALTDGTVFGTEVFSGTVTEGEAPDTDPPDAPVNLRIVSAVFTP